MITSFVPKTGHLLILANGVYGERIQKIAEVHEIPHSTLVKEWGEPFEAEEIERVLKGNLFISGVAVVHHETTTGRLNDLRMVGDLCRAYNVLMFVDAVSSFGAEEIQFEEWGIAALAASSNKCLHGIPGASFVVARRDMFTQGLCRFVYGDLKTHYEKQESGSNVAFTQAVHAFYAFQEALSEFQEAGGWRARHREYNRRAEIVRSEAARIGLRPYLQSGPRTCAMTAYYIPERKTYAELHDALKEKGFVIYAGQGAISSKIFRISNMGSIPDSEFRRLFEELSRTL